jgi:Zn-finger nucleic acid-binding protein
MADAVTLNCPMCGAPATSDSALCAHCGARLATVACPSCFGLMFVGSKFCSHCGAEAGRSDADKTIKEKCPICREVMAEILVGTTRLMECPKGEGVWVDGETLQQICKDREKQAAVLGMGGSTISAPSGELEHVKYRPCPVCEKLMNRVNFAHCSHVIVDVCMAHGTWCDRDELRQIVEFIRNGGLEFARSRQIEELEQRRRELNSMEGAGSWNTQESPPRRSSYSELGIDVAADFLRSLFSR